MSLKICQHYPQGVLSNPYSDSPPLYMKSFVHDGSYEQPPPSFDVYTVDETNALHNQNYDRIKRLRTADDEIKTRLDNSIDKLFTELNNLSQNLLSDAIFREKLVQAIKTDIIQEIKEQLKQEIINELKG
jgi:hypothetical protein